MQIDSRLTRISAQIKIHKSQAFLDNPIFSPWQCNHPAYCSQSTIASVSLSGDAVWNTDYYPSAIAQPLASTANNSSQAFSSIYQDNSIPMPNTQTELPFSAKYSAKVCLRAALAISHTVQVLSNPDPLYILAHKRSISDASRTWLKRDPFTYFPLATPSFVSCLARGGYTMSRICCKARIAQRVSAQLDLGSSSGVAASDKLACRATQNGTPGEIHHFFLKPCGAFETISLVLGYEHSRRSITSHLSTLSC
ncbi:uncharacterized protein BDW43DRAFT_233842 [Aspergillus alliaceus]|uniref:uncharacterized protein n=1 Tax=Petromyces alliaceus TaxID=209559 RepID=UPI0012A55507|nr:uncharacterized protein BDW43DRAFT_233842 [Aspergillus alliaceus]KAB8227971.1 hypothetical protein BDW43DRAFT_233842 [Aspergillus alliaceus]